MTFEHSPGGCCCPLGRFDFHGPAPQNTPNVRENNEHWLESSVVPEGSDFSTGINGHWSFPSPYEWYISPFVASQHEAAIVRSLHQETNANELVWVLRSGNPDHPDAGLSNSELVTDSSDVQEWTLGADTRASSDARVEVTTNSATANCYAKTPVTGMATTGPTVKNHVSCRIKQGELDKIAINVVGSSGLDSKIFVDFGTLVDGLPTIESSTADISGAVVTKSFGGSFEIDYDISQTTDANGHVWVRPYSSTTTPGGWTIDEDDGDGFWLWYLSIRQDNGSYEPWDALCLDATDKTLIYHWLPRVASFQYDLMEGIQSCRRGAWNNSSSTGETTPKLSLDYWDGHRNFESWQTGPDAAFFWRSEAVDGSNNHSEWVKIPNDGKDAAGGFAYRCGNQFSQYSTTLGRSSVEIPLPCSVFGTANVTYGSDRAATAGGLNTQEHFARIVVVPPHGDSRAVSILRARPHFLGYDSEALFITASKSTDTYCVKIQSVEQTVEVTSGAIEYREGLEIPQATFDFSADPWTCADTTETVDRLVGSSSNAIFSLTSTQDRIAYLTNRHNLGGDRTYGPAMVPDDNPESEGDQVWAHVLWADSYGSTVGAIILYGEKTVTINNASSITGGDSSGVWYPSDSDPQPTETSTERMWLTIRLNSTIHTTEEVYRDDDAGGALLTGDSWFRSMAVTPPSNINQMVGVSHRFAWFEQIWETEPTSTTPGVVGKWRLHVKLPNGTTTYSVDGWPGRGGDEPGIIATSEEHLCIVGFFYGDDRLKYSSSVPRGQSHDCWLFSHRGNVADGDKPYWAVPIGIEDDQHYNATDETGNKFWTPVQFSGHELTTDVDVILQHDKVEQSLKARDFARPSWTCGVWSVARGPSTSTPNLQWTITMTEEVGATFSTADLALSFTGGAAATITSLTQDGSINTEWLLEINVVYGPSGGTITLGLADSHSIVGEDSGTTLTDFSPRRLDQRTYTL